MTEADYNFRRFKILHQLRLDQSKYPTKTKAEKAERDKHTRAAASELNDLERERKLAQAAEANKQRAAEAQTKK